MAWYLIKAEFVMDNGERFTDSTWVEGDDYIAAAEKARRNRQWDLRDLMRRAEFGEPQNVRYAHFEAKKYDVRSKELISFDLGNGEITNRVYIASHPWERHGDYDG